MRFRHGVRRIRLFDWATDAPELREGDAPRCALAAPSRSYPLVAQSTPTATRTHAHARTTSSTAQGVAVPVSETVSGTA